MKIFHPGLEEGSIGADDFPPIFVWVLVQTEMVTAEIEADYILGLSHSSMLSGESGYYLASLSSAVNALKNFKPIHKDNPQAKSSVSIVGIADFFFKAIFTIVLFAEVLRVSMGISNVSKNRRSR